MTEYLTIERLKEIREGRVGTMERVVQDLMTMAHELIMRRAVDEAQPAIAVAMPDE